MPEFLPFPGIRYNPDALDNGHDGIVAPPYDVIDEEDRVQLEANDPRNAVRLILPRDSAPDAEDRYVRAAALLREWWDAGAFLQDQSCFYLYRMGFTDQDGRPCQTSGVIGALGLTPSAGGNALPHERTMPKAKSDRLALLKALRYNLDPIWGLSLAPGLSHLLEPSGPPIARCTDPDGIHHRLYLIEERGRIETIAEAVGNAPLVIADGHHRYETALAYREESIAAGQSVGEHDRIMAFVVELNEEQLCVRSIHRLLTLLPTDHNLRDLLAGAFTVTPLGANTPDGVDMLRQQMDEVGALGLVDTQGLALLMPRSEVCDPLLLDVPEPTRGVDASIFDVVVLPALDGSGSEVSYLADAHAVAQLVAKTPESAAILLRPVTVSQIEAAARAGVRMPEKTTFFHPKPRTGFVLRSLDR